jgi:RNA polymerase sigma factor (sigma-70 family)
MKREMDDWTLLRDYCEGRSEAAFAELVRRHADLVYSAARRQTEDPHLAADVAQAVFLSLARKGRTLACDVVIPGWLILATRLESANLLRDRARRARREQLAAEMNPQPSPNPLDAAWERVAPLLDEGLAGLREMDRNAVVLHFLRRRTFQEIGEALGLSEEAARKRVSRALDFLRAFFSNRGISLPGTTLAGALVAFGVQAAPQTLAAGIVSAVGASGAVSAGVLASTFYKTIQIMAWTKTKTAIVTVLALAAVPVGLQWRQNRELRRQVGELQSALQQRQTEMPVSADPQVAATRVTAPPRAVPTADKPAGSPALPSVRDIMQRAIALTSTSKSREETVKEIEPLLSQIPAADLKQAADLALGIPDRNWRMGFLHMLLRRWASTDGGAALSFLTQNVKGDAQSPLLAGVLPIWAEREPEAAWSWFQTNARQELQFDARGNHNAALGAMFAAMGRTDFGRSLGRALELQGIDAMNALVGLSEAAQNRDQRLQLLAQADSLGDARWREEVRKGILSVWGGAQPSEARRYVEGLSDAALRSEGARHVGPSLIAANPEAAAKWWLSQTIESDQPRALREITQRWTEVDLVGAGKWLQTLGNGPEIDVAKREFALAAAMRAPEPAMNWASAISDSEKRLRTMREVYVQWNGQNPAEAQRWLATAGLAPEVVSAVTTKKP